MDCSERTWQVIDTIPQQIWSGPPGGSLDFCNEQWRSYMGLTQEELQGDGWQRMLHPEDRERVLKAWSESVAKGTPYEQEERHRRADGKYRWFLSRGVPLRDSKERIVRWYGTNTDIEEQKRTGYALQEAHAQVARITHLLAMAELVASIAHEIKQPLTAVVTDISAGLRWLSRDPPNLQEARGAMVVAIREANRAGDIIARIRASLRSTPPPMQPLNINEVILEALTIARSELQGQSITVQTELAGNIPPLIGDRIRLQQLLLNLITNSVAAMSTISDRPRELLIKSAPHPDGVLIQVQDTGTGLDPGQADRIFEPFVTSKPDGIGLGLSISRSIVEDHGGSLWAEQRSTGAIFAFTMPTEI